VQLWKPGGDGVSPGFASGDSDVAICVVKLDAARDRLIRVTRGERFSNPDAQAVHCATMYVANTGRNSATEPSVLGGGWSEVVDLNC
jgi:hypothetical protein